MKESSLRDTSFAPVNFTHPRSKDLTGAKFGKLTVQKCLGKRNGKTHWLCLCGCGNETVRVTSNLNARTKSCGCLKVHDLQEQRFGRLLVIAFERIDSKRRAYWLCQCDCGNRHIVSAESLVRGRTRSCGCLLRESHLKHGMFGTRVYAAWASMKGRCENSSNPSYSNYGGRGIKVCERWQTFENFYADMGDHPSSRHSLDRREVNGNYEPNNCRWAAPEEQQNNRRNNHYLEYEGKVQTVKLWSQEKNLSIHALYKRLEAGWDVARVLETPVRQSNV